MKKLALVTVLFVGALTMSANTPEIHNTKSIAEATITNPGGVSTFCMAIVKGDFETVKKLVELGADIEERSKGLTPLMYAAKFNKTDILEYLIEKGANLKARDTNNGFTALKFAELSNAKEAKAILEKALNA